MSRFKSYVPEQPYVLPPRVEDELSEEHLCFFVRRVVERLDLRQFRQSYAAEGGLLYALELMLSVWLYGYATGVTSARQLERRLIETFLCAILRRARGVDNWALSAFRRRHRRALNDALRRCWRGPGRWAWCGWARWRSTRRGSRQAPAATAWKASSSCATCAPI